MTTPTSPPYCPDCGEPLPTDSPQALCPACLMRQALASRTIVDGETNAPAAPPLSPEEIADKFPQFEILECLGRGGMGVVYKARQKSLNRLVAIKILAPERVHEARFAERFAREAELLAKLNHPHIVTIHDFGETGGLFYLVMEFVDGVNLRDLLRDGRLEPKQALAIVPPICEALQYAHDKGVVHRDIKPENLLLDRDGRIKIADFGIALLVGAEDGSAGTPPYMAPEQSGSSTAIDHRTDIYALGVVLYEMLTGERPQKDLVAPSKKVQIDVRLDEMVLRALEKSPELRYQTAGEFRTVVETLQTPAAPPAAMPPSFPGATKQSGPFRRFWWLFLVMIPVGVLFGVGFGGAWLSLAPKKYQAQSVVQFVPVPGSATSQHSPANRIAAVYAEEALLQACRGLDLSRRWQVPEPEAVIRLRRTVAALPIRGTDLLSIRVHHTNGKESAEIANGMASVLEVRAAQLPTTSERIIVHERAVTPTLPVSPNPALLLGISAAAGLGISPLLALLSILVLSRRSAGTTPNHNTRRRWIIAAGIAVVAALFAMWSGSGASDALSPDDGKTLIGRAKFDFEIPQTLSGGWGAELPVFEGQTSRWFPPNGQPVQMKDGRTLHFRVLTMALANGRPKLFVGISGNGKDWSSESVEMGPAAGTVPLDLDHGVKAVLQWIPDSGSVPAQSTASRPMGLWFGVSAGAVTLLLMLIVRRAKSASSPVKMAGLGCMTLFIPGVVMFVVWSASLYFSSVRAVNRTAEQARLAEQSLPVEATGSDAAQETNPARAPAAPIAVTVLGAVARPGKHALRADATLLDALAAAGGWTDNAKLDEILVTTPDGQGGKHDLHEILAGRAANPAISAGHQVFVVRRNP